MKKKRGRMQMPFLSPGCLIYDNVCVYPYQITLTRTTTTKKNKTTSQPTFLNDRCSS